MATKNVTCSKLSIVDIKSSFADGVEVGDDIPVSHSTAIVPSILIVFDVLFIVMYLVVLVFVFVFVFVVVFGKGESGHNLTHYCSWWSGSGTRQFLGSSWVEFIRPIILNITPKRRSEAVLVEDMKKSSPPFAKLPVIQVVGL